MSENKPQLDRSLDETAPMRREKRGFYQAYMLEYWREQAGSPGQGPSHHFVLQEVSESRRRYQFETLEQVMNFLLDTLLEDAAWDTQTTSDS